MIKASEFQAISVELIDVVDPLRQPELLAVESLALDIERQGLLQPIVVEKGGLGKGRYRLIAGGHRLAAVKQLEWPTISANVLDNLKEGEARMMEIAENLRRIELCPVDRAVFLKEWKRLYEEENPKSRHGAASIHDKDASDASLSFADYASAELGFAKRTIQQAVQLCDIDEPDLKRLQDSDRDFNQSELLKIARLYNRKAEKHSRAFQSKVVTAVLKRPDTTVHDVIQQVLNLQPVQKEILPDWQKLSNQFQGLAHEDRVRFFELNAEAIKAWLAACEAGNV